MKEKLKKLLCKIWIHNYIIYDTTDWELGCSIFYKCSRCTKDKKITFTN
mgnify:CR=1 FL=1